MVASVAPKRLVSLPVLPEIERTSAASTLADEALGPRDMGFVKTLRISITDHCNLRCVYCMPAEGLRWQPRDHLLTPAEIESVARAALHHGVRNFKLTGGEPLVRGDLTDIVARLRATPGVGELSLTTNAILLERMADDLHRAGVDRLTVSLDTLRPDRFRHITRTGDLQAVWRGLDAAERCGFPPAKLNVVVLRDHNLDEVADFAALTLDSSRTVRFIEYMPLGQAQVLLEGDQLAPYAEIRAAIESRFGPLEPARRDTGHGPAHVWRIPGATGRIGFIHAMSHPFCSTCNRLRLTSDGLLRACLFDGGEIDLKPLLRPAPRTAALRQAFVDCVQLRPELHASHGNRQMSQIGG